MANPSWKKGCSSPNPQGRAKMKHSAKTIKGAVERFIRKNYSVNKLQAIHDKLDERGKLQMLDLLINYALPKQTQLSVTPVLDDLSDADLKKLHNRVFGSIDQPEPIQVNESTTLIPAQFNRYGQE